MAARVGQLLLRRIRELALDPPHDHVDDIAVLGLGEFVSACDAMVALEAAATTDAGGVLRDEHRVTAVRRLPAVLGRRRRSEPPRDHVLGVPADRLKTAELNERSFTAAQVKARPERLGGERVESLVDGLERS